MEEGFASARGARGGTAPIASSTSPSWHASKPSSSTRRAALSACDLACSLRLFVCEPRDLKINLRTIAWHSLPGARRRAHHPFTFTPLRQSRRLTRVDRTPPALRRVLESSDEVDASQAPADREGKKKQKEKENVGHPDHVVRVRLRMRQRHLDVQAQGGDLEQPQDPRRPGAPSNPKPITPTSSN